MCAQGFGSFSGFSGFAFGGVFGFEVGCLQVYGLRILKFWV